MENCMLNPPDYDWDAVRDDDDEEPWFDCVICGGPGVDEVCASCEYTADQLAEAVAA